MLIDGAVSVIIVPAVFVISVGIHSLFLLNAVVITTEKTRFKLVKGAAHGYHPLCKVVENMIQQPVVVVNDKYKFFLITTAGCYHSNGR